MSLPGTDDDATATVEEVLLAQVRSETTAAHFRPSLRALS